MSKKGGYKIIDFLNNDIETQTVIPGIYNNLLNSKEKQLMLSGIVFDDVLIDDCAVVSIGIDSDDNIIILANALKITITEDDEVTAESFNLLNEIDSLAGDVEDLSTEVTDLYTNELIDAVIEPNEHYTISNVKVYRKGKTIMLSGEITDVDIEAYPTGQTRYDLLTINEYNFRWSITDTIVAFNGDYKPVQLSGENDEINKKFKLNVRGGSVGGRYEFRIFIFLQ